MHFEERKDLFSKACCEGSPSPSGEQARAEADAPGHERTQAHWQPTAAQTRTEQSSEAEKSTSAPAAV